MNGRTVGVILAVVGFITLNFGILVPSMEDYYYYLGCVGAHFSPRGLECSIPPTSFTSLFFAGLGIAVVGVGLVLRARRTETAWIVKP